MPELRYIKEPGLLFRHDQAVEDPRDGLTLFGPLDEGKPYGIRWGLIGPEDSLQRVERWVSGINRRVVDSEPARYGRKQSPSARGPDLARPPYPGFHAAFEIPWSNKPVQRLTVPEKELAKVAFLDDPHQRVFNTVNAYSERIIDCLRREEARPDVWCVAIPEYVYLNCRQRSYVETSERVKAEARLTRSEAKAIAAAPLLFEEENKLAKPYEYELNFHHQLKARLLSHNAPTQIIRETTIAHRDFLDSKGEPTRKLDGMESAIAWTISTAAFYKSGGRPWKLGAARPGVCYVGLVFKQDEKHRDPRTACCAAQMFLDSGDGVVFKGAVGPWYRGKRGLFHLSREAATEVIRMCIDSYADRFDGEPPDEVFIHGRVRFEDDEWAGFLDGAGGKTRVVGVRIRDDEDLKVFRRSAFPILRGHWFRIGDRMASLWTRGFVPRLRSYPGLEVPNPLFIDVCRGEADIETVVRDVLALTKLNYNSCVFADGAPVTLKFAKAVGEILTAGPLDGTVPPLPFKHYI
ncbi:hypothetical protein RAS1_07900 [Phycisphaerae bacterium RAS1]|nr:hypothetical protein RAS1_07900 [Phycisphaerae bacterium RAS1]